MRARPLVFLSALVIVSAAALPLDRHAPMWMGTIAGKDGAALSGSVMMSPGSDPATTVVEVKLTGDVAASVRPWHIHIGSCASAGGVLGGGKSYTPITVDAAGAGSSRATLPIALPDTGRYYVNIHESAASMGKIVGCGDLMKHDM